MAFFLTMTYFAMKFKLTNESGSIDANNRYFQEMHDKYNQSFKVDSVSMMRHRYEVLNRILVLNDYYPKNAQYILEAYQNSKDEKIALQMLDAVDLRLKDNEEYMSAIQELREKRFKRKKTTGLSVFEWMNIEEWKAFRIAVQKDKKWIDSAAHASCFLGCSNMTWLPFCLTCIQPSFLSSRNSSLYLISKVIYLLL